MEIIRETAMDWQDNHEENDIIGQIIDTINKRTDKIVTNDQDQPVEDLTTNTSIEHEATP